MTPTSGSLHLAWDGPCHFLDATAGVCVFHTTASWGSCHLGSEFLLEGA